MSESMTLKGKAMIAFGKGNNGSATRYEDQKREIDRSFPGGRFVAVESDAVVADAESHRALVEKLQAQGKSPKDLLIVQAGVDYPASAVIFFQPLARPSHV
jgi:hypothetical protein